MGLTQIHRFTFSFHLSLPFAAIHHHSHDTGMTLPDPSGRNAFLLVRCDMTLKKEDFFMDALPRMKSWTDYCLRSLRSCSCKYLGGWEGLPNCSQLRYGPGLRRREPP